MPIIAEIVQKKSYERGVRFHEPSQQFIAEIGYHEVSEVAADGTVTNKRVRTTHYLGGLADRNRHITRFRSIKADWDGTVIGLRREYDATQQRRRVAGLPPLPRFTPVWPNRRVVRKARQSKAALTPAVLPQSHLATVAISTAEQSELSALPKMTIRDAYKLHVEQQKKRVGLMAGKGINANTYEKHIQSLTLGLALNPTYSRTTRPIDLDKRLGDLTAADYEAFVRFWCDPAVVKSKRTALNYTRAFRQMITRLDLPTPRKFNEIFTIKITQPTKIVRYNPDLLRIFLQHEDERVQMLSLLCLNCGYYQVDIARLLFEHVTDFDGNPYTSGDMFITKRRERTRHQNLFTTTVYVWPETQRLMEKLRAPRENPFGTYFLSQLGTPYSVKTVAWIVEQVIRERGLGGQFSLKQFRKIGASQLKALAGSDAMHQYKANSLSAADRPYIDEDYNRLTNALQIFAQSSSRTTFFEARDGPRHEEDPDRSQRPPHCVVLGERPRRSTPDTRMLQRQLAAARRTATEPIPMRSKPCIVMVGAILMCGCMHPRWDVDRATRPRAWDGHPKTQDWERLEVWYVMHPDNRVSAYVRRRGDCFAEKIGEGRQSETIGAPLNWVTDITFHGVTDRYWGHPGPKGPGMVTVVPYDFVLDPAKDPRLDHRN